jgi:rRNA-processing protein FCF1
MCKYNNDQKPCCRGQAILTKSDSLKVMSLANEKYVEVETYRIRKEGLSQVENKIIKVILDSNAFFVPLDFRIDILDDLKKLLNRNFELILISQVKEELEALVKKGSPKMRKKASYALKFAEKCNYVDVNASASAQTDDVIVKTAKEWKAMVFTNDRGLKEKLRNISVPVIYVRQKSRLEIDGMI